MYKPVCYVIRVQLLYNLIVKVQRSSFKWWLLSNTYDFCMTMMAKNIYFDTNIHQIDPMNLILWQKL